MQWFYKRTALILSIFIVAISVSVLIGRQQAPSQNLSRLYLNTVCQLPCWLGITPGETSTKEAGQKLMSFYGAIPTYKVQIDPENYSYLIFDRLSGKQLFSVDFSADLHNLDMERVGEIFIDFTSVDRQTGNWKPLEANPSFGDLIASLGNP